MKRSIRYLSVVAMAALLALTALVGCGGTGTARNSGDTAAIGCLSVRVNPEIDVHYDENGKVTRLVGENQEGKEILEGYSGYEGKDCAVVVRELVRRIKDAGYFVPAEDGAVRDVMLQIEPGSRVPNDEFLPGIKQEVKGLLAEIEVSGQVLEIDVDDYDPKYEKEEQASAYINEDKALEIALSHSGVAAKDAAVVEKEYDLDDGTPGYEIEFRAAGYEYDYDIDARNGKVLKAHKEKDDDANEESTQPGSAQVIGKDKALKIALSHSGVAAKDASQIENEYDQDDGRANYEIEFWANGYEYDYEIDAQTGKVQKAHKEKDDTNQKDQDRQDGDTDDKDDEEDEEEDD